MKQKILDFLKYIFPLIFLTVVAGVSLTLSYWLTSDQGKPPLIEGQLRPEKIKTEVPTKVIPVSTQSANVRIEEQILGSKSVLNKILVTDKGNDLLVLINKKISLPSSYEPSDLVSLVGSVSSVSGATLRSEAAIALIDLINSAKSVGVNLSVVSAYRSYSQQVSVFNGWVASACLKSAESFSARAGHSQHQLGTAVDLGIPGKSTFNEAFGNSLEGQWLAANAYNYGYVLSYPNT
jgi:LAS superfamily LD-carboxypeptidase LdcB